MHFQIILSLWELEVMADLLCDYYWKMFEQIVTVVYLSNQKWSVKKGALKNFANFTENHLCWVSFIIKLQALRPATFFKRDSDTGVLRWNLRSFKSTYFEEHLWTSACFCIFIGGFLYNAWSCDGDLWWRFFAKAVNIF